MLRRTICVRSAGKALPDEIKLALTEQHKTSIHLALVGEGPTIDMHAVDGKEFDLLQNLESVEEQLKDTRVTYLFQDAPDGLNESDIPPYPIIKDGERVLVAAFTDGDFIEHVKEKNTYSPDYFMATDWLANEINTIFAEDCGKDLAKLHAQLDTAQTRRMMRSKTSPRGYITLIFADEKLRPITFFEHGKPGAAYEFGWMSRDVLKKEEPKKEEPAKPKLALDLKKKDGKAEVKKEEKKEETPPKSDSKEEFLEIPATLYGKKRKQFIRKTMGYLPENHLDLKAIPVSKLRSTGGIAQGLRRMAAAVGLDPGPTPTEQVKTEGMPAIIFPNNKKKILEVLKKNKGVKDPEELIQEAERFDPASEQLEMTDGIRGYFRLDKDTFRLIMNDPPTAYCVGLELLSELAERDPSLTQPSKEEESKQEEKEAATDSKKPILKLNLKKTGT